MIADHSINWHMNISIVRLINSSNLETEKDASAASSQLAAVGGQHNLDCARIGRRQIMEIKEFATLPRATRFS